MSTARVELREPSETVAGIRLDDVDDVAERVCFSPGQVLGFVVVKAFDHLTLRSHVRRPDGPTCYRLRESAVKPDN